MEEQSAYCMKYNFFYLTYIMQVLIVLTAVYSFHIGYYAGTFFGLVAVGLSLIPTLVHRKMHIVVPWEVTFLIALTFSSISADTRITGTSTSIPTTTSLPTWLRP